MYSVAPAAELLSHSFARVHSRSEVLVTSFEMYSYTSLQTDTGPHSRLDVGVQALVSCSKAFSHTSVFSHRRLLVRVAGTASYSTSSPLHCLHSRCLRLSQRPSGSLLMDRLWHVDSDRRYSHLKTLAGRPPEARESFATRRQDVAQLKASHGGTSHQRSPIGRKRCGRLPEHAVAS